MKELLLDGAARHICIRFPNGEYEDTTTGILSESMSLEGILNSSADLNFGECNASKFGVEVAGVADISGLKIQVYELVDGYENEIMLFTGTVDSAKARPERDARQIVAYDEIHYHSDDNVSEWYDSMFSKSDKEEYKGVWSSDIGYVANNTVQYNGVYYRYLCGTADQFSVVTDYDDDGNEITVTYNAADYCKGKTPEQLQEDEHGHNYIQRLEVYNPYNYGFVTLKQFRMSLMGHIGIQQEDVTLINDNIQVTKTLDSTELKFSDCIKAVCQMAGCFGHMSETGIFQYIYLGQVDTVDYSGNYKASNSSYEEYTTKPIDSVRIYDNAGVASTIYGAGNNPWNLQGNFLLYGLSTEVLNIVAKTIYDYVSTISYTPASIEALLSLPIKMGSGVTVTTHTGDVFSFYALRNTLSGGQLASQVIVAEGSETRNNSATLSNQLALLESKTTSIVENVYQKITADSAEIKTIYGDLANYKVVVAEKIQAQEGEFESLFAKQAEFETVTTQNLAAATGRVDVLSGDLANYKTVVAKEFQAIRADIGDLDVTKLTARVASIEEAYIDEAKVNSLLAGYATIEQLNATNAIVHSLKGDYAEFKTFATDELAANKALINELGAKAVTTEYLKSNYAEIDLANIKQGCITNAMIGTGAVDTAQIADGSITDAKIVELTANKVTAGTLSVERLEIRGSTNSLVYALNDITGALQAQNVDTLNGEILTPRTITADKVVANSITGNEIAAKTITANNIVANSITGNEIAAKTITAINLAANSVTADKIVAGTITGAKIASKTITANNIAANTITAGQIASGAIATDKLAANAVTAAKINVNDLFAQDITATGTITGAKLVGATGSFTGSIIANDIVIKETIKMRGADSTTDRNAVMLNDYGGTLIINIGDPEIDTDEFQTFVALNANTILLNGTVQAYGGGIDASSNQIKCGELKCSSVYATGEIRSVSANAFRAIYGDIGFIVRNDGTSTYFLFTASGNAYGTFNSLRPLYFNNTTGVVTMGNGAIVKGNLNTTTVSTYSGDHKPLGSIDTNGNRVSGFGAQSSTQLRVWGQWGTANASYSSRNITVASSDIRLKTNIRDSEVNALEAIARIQIRQFDWTDIPRHQRIGFVADELEMVDKNLAVGGGYDEDGSMNIKGVDDFYLLGYAIKGIQELCAVNIMQDKQLTVIASRQDTQEAWMENLQYQLSEARAQIAQQAAEIARMKGMLQAVA